MKYYLLNHQQLYDLSCQHTYTIGNTKQDDIILDTLETKTIRIIHNQILYDNQSYFEGIHQVILDENHIIKLFILTHQHCFIMQNKTTIITHH